MIAQTNVPFEVVATGAAPDLVGVITVEVYDPSDGATIVPATTAGITEPRAGTYRAQLSVPTAGTYAIRWVTPTEPFEQLLTVSDAAVPPEAQTEFRPTVAALGSIMRARTKTPDQGELGTFTTETRPTAVEAELMLDHAFALVAGQLGEVPDRLLGLATAIVTLRAAMYVETSYFPEEVVVEQSAYERYHEQYDDAMKTYATALDGGAAVDPTSRMHLVRIGTIYTTPPDPNDPYSYMYDPWAVLP